MKERIAGRARCHYEPRRTITLDELLERERRLRRNLLLKLLLSIISILLVLTFFGYGAYCLFQKAVGAVSAPCGIDGHQLGAQHRRQRHALSTLRFDEEDSRVMRGAEHEENRPILGAVSIARPAA